MNNADMLIHVHPDLDAQATKKLERKLESHIGIDCAGFIHRPHPHALLVKYDPDTMQGKEILQMVRKLDPAAMMAGL
jgi:hypothetical protein